MWMSSLRPEIRNLPVADRIALAQCIWDSISEECAELPVSDALKQELDTRIADLEKRPEQLDDVDTVINRLLGK